MNWRHSSDVQRSSREGSFTLIELLTVITIIAILAAITLAAASGAMKQAYRTRTKNEIAAMSAGLERYKTDNGAYPVSTVFSTTNNYSASPLPTTLYQSSAQLLYQSLTGQTNFTDTPVAGAKSYMTFKKSQLGNYKAGSPGTTYVQDAFGTAYGYFTGSTSDPYNGTNFFDLWSSAGDTTGTNTATWINNWGS